MKTKRSATAATQINKESDAELLLNQINIIFQLEIIEDHLIIMGEWERNVWK